MRAKKKWAGVVFAEALGLQASFCDTYFLNKHQELSSLHTQLWKYVFDFIYVKETLFCCVTDVVRSALVKGNGFTFVFRLPWYDMWLQQIHVGFKLSALKGKEKKKGLLMD